MVKRYIRLMLAIIILFLIFTLINFTDWYFFITSRAPVPDSLLGTFQYKIQPVLVVTDAAISAISLNYYLRGQKLILHSLETDEADFFNKGYSWMNSSLMLNVAGYCLLILSTAFRLALDYLIK